MKTRLARLEATLKDSEHFSPEMTLSLQELASGREMTVIDLLTNLALIVEDASDHIHATGDEKAERALRHLLAGLSGVDPEPQVTLIREPTRRQGR
jgi:hypothetical protein